MFGPQALSNVSGILVACLIVGAILLDISRDVRRIVSGRNVALITILAWYLAEAVWIPPELQYTSQPSYHYAMLCLALAVAAFLFTYHRVQGGMFDDFAARLYRIDNPNVLWWVFLVSFGIGMFPLLLLTGFDVQYLVESAFTFSQRWSGRLGRGRYGDARSAFLELQMFLRAAVPIAVVLLFDRRASSLRRMACAAFVTWMLARAISSGTRSNVLPVLLPILAAVYWLMREQTRRIALLFGLPALVVLGVVWSAAMVASRNAGDFRWEAARTTNYVGFEMFRELVYLTENIPDRMEYRYGHTYYVQIVNPIPRFLWPGKPTADAGLALAELRGAVNRRTGEAYLTNSPGILGEMYWNFGLPGIVGLSALCGYIVKSWDRMRYLLPRSQLSFIVFAAGLAVIFLSGRSFTMPTYYGMLSLYGLMIVLELLIAAPRKSRRLDELVQTRLAGGRLPDSRFAERSSVHE